MITEQEAGKELGKRQKRFTEKDMETVLSREESLQQKFTTQQRLKVHFKDFKMLFSMLRDYTSKNYTQVPWYTISAIGAVLLYVISPLDLIPDFIPFVGYLDDATVLAFCLNLVHKDLMLYKVWKEKTVIANAQKTRE